jgi:demethylmenaquinone methyltransferase/2-methoxy-6-polyprenyl-1,4-benzoquinol methylase
MADEQAQIGRMFGRIAASYDFLNHVLSLGQDFVWRREVAECIDDRSDVRLADFATGTGDVLISVLKRRRNIRRAVGVDVSPRMLRICRGKLSSRRLSGRVGLVCADVCESGLADEGYDVVTMGFGIRNVEDVWACLGEIRRILRPGGRAVILEFARPTQRWMSRAYGIYLKGLVPVIGGLFSGDYDAYRYLSRTIESFYSPFEFTGLMIDSGFSDVAIQSLSLGIVCIYTGTKR